MVTVCPEHSTSPPGSHTISNCSCAASMYMFNNNRCERCPPSSTSAVGSTTVTSCICHINFYLSLSGYCTNTVVTTNTTSNNSSSSGDSTLFHMTTTGAASTAACCGCPPGTSSEAGVTSASCCVTNEAKTHQTTNTPNDNGADMSVETVKAVCTGTCSDNKECTSHHCGLAHPVTGAGRYCCHPYDWFIAAVNNNNSNNNSTNRTTPLTVVGDVVDDVVGTVGVRINDVVGTASGCLSCNMDGTCAYCNKHYYLNHHRCIACPTHSINRKTGSTNYIDCSCASGMYMSPTHPHCFNCPTNTTSKHGACGVGNCSICISGLYKSNRVCSKQLQAIYNGRSCPVMCDSCPLHSSSFQGSLSVSDCRCRRSMYMYNTTHSDHRCFWCPLNSDAHMGSVGFQSCQCRKGMYMSSGQCVACPVDSVGSVFGSINVTDCKV